MIITKAREHSIDVLQLEALLRRLPQSHLSYERVYTDLKKASSGIKGEKEVSFPLRFLKKDSSYLLHNLRIPDQNGAFQIDTLLLTNTYILLLEIKNWYGTIIFGENGQVIRVRDDGREEGFPNPLPQVKLQRHRLKQWLQAKNMPTIPIIYFIVISYPSTIIKSISPTCPIPDCVIHTNNLFFSIQKLDRQFTKQKINNEQLKNCSAELIKTHTPLKKEILTKYHIYKEELITGVFCPKCLRAQMLRRLQKWYCTFCDTFSSHAHLDALKDYKLLINSHISNREVRKFLHIKSPYVAKHILQKEGFRKQGETSRTTYELYFHDIPNM